MKIKYTKTLKDGRQHRLIEMLPGETKHLMAIVPDAFWKLDYPLEDQVVESHHLKDIKRVCWDAYSQNWVDA